MPTPLALSSVEVVSIDSPVETPAFVVEPIVVVAPLVPAPTLVDGRPQ